MRGFWEMGEFCELGEFDKLWEEEKNENIVTRSAHLSLRLKNMENNEKAKKWPEKIKKKKKIIGVMMGFEPTLVIKNSRASAPSTAPRM